MGIDSRYHINVADQGVLSLVRQVDGDPRSLGVGSADENAGRLQEFVNSLEALGGGYLYFPPGRYFIGRTTVQRLPSINTEEFGDIVVPPNVTLWFAPKAVLVPMMYQNEGRFRTTHRRMIEGLSQEDQLSVRIEIHGDIIAERRQIFASFQGFVPGFQIDDVQSPRAGKILLVGRRTLEVYPEWWGAVGGANPDEQGPINSEAFQRAIDAAYHNRTTALRNDDGSLTRDRGVVQWNHRNAIPIVAMGQYYIDRGLLVGVSESWRGSTELVNRPNSDGFQLKGERGLGGSGGGRPCLWASEQFQGESLLTIRGPLGFAIEYMGFEGNFRAPTCLRIEPVGAAWAPCEIESCSFSRTGHTLLVLDAEVHRIVTATDTGVEKTDFWNLSLTRCYFDTGAVGDGMMDPGDITRLIRSGRIPDQANNIVCIEARLGDNQGLELRTCWLRGRASPGVRAFSGRFAMNECLSHITRPGRLSPTNDSHPDWLLPDFPHGADIVVEAPDLSRGDPGIPRLVPSTFTIREHQSHSWQLFSCAKVPPRATAAVRASAVVLLNVKSGVEADQVGAHEIDPPAVYWPTGGPGNFGCRLVMIGCHFTGKPLNLSSSGRHLTPEENNEYRSVVFVGMSVNADIFNIGTNLFNFDRSSDLPRLLELSIRVCDSAGNPVDRTVRLGLVVRQLRAIEISSS